MQWLGEWSDYSHHVKSLASELKTYGVRAKTTRSHFEGHRILLIAAKDVEKAKQVLPEIDHVHGKFIAEQL